MAACSAGGGGLTPAGRDSRSGNARFSIVVPPAVNAGSARAPKYVSPATQSISISVNGGAPTVTNLTSGSTNCSSGGSGPTLRNASPQQSLTCTVDVTAPIATDTFLLKLYSGLNAGGTVLATTTVTQAITGNTPIAISMNGVAHTVILSLADASPIVGEAATIPVNVTVEDPSGAIITGPGNYDAPISISDSDTSGHTHLSTTSVAGPSTPVTLSYDGNSSVASVTISATLAGAISSVTPAVLRPANAQNGGGGVAVVNIGGNAYAEIPSASGLIQVRLTNNGALATTPPSPDPGASGAPVFQTNSTLLPIDGGIDACALGHASSSIKMFCVNVDTAGAPVNVIDLASGTPSLASTFATDAANELDFSGGSCYVCGLTWDARDNAVLISTGNVASGTQGSFSDCYEDNVCSGAFELYGGSGTRLGNNIYVPDMPENFGYNASTNQVFAATYNQVNLVDVASGTVYQSTDAALQSKDIDSSAVDPVTNVAVGIDEYDGNAYIAPLSGAVLASPQPGSTQYTFSDPLVSAAPVAGDIDMYGQGCLPDAITVDSTSHTAFLSGEYSAPNCVSAFKLPASAPDAPFAPAQYMGIANMPNTPDGNEFDSALDPHVAASFYLSGSDLYGLIYNYDRSWVAVVDITKLLAAPGMGCDPHMVDPSYDLIGNGVVTYIPTGFNPGPASNGYAYAKRRLRTHARPPLHRMLCGY